LGSAEKDEFLWINLFTGVREISSTGISQMMIKEGPPTFGVRCEENQ